MATQRTVDHEGDYESPFEPRTELARKLWEIRQRFVAAGVPLLDWDGIEREVAERRGGGRL